MNRKILGLDIGTNSIGWALVNEDNNWFKNIEAIGSRIIPEKDEHRDFEKGRDISKNATRRIKRGSRRLNERYKQRRNNLIKLFSILEIIPSGLESLFEKIIIKNNKVICPQSAYHKGDKQFKPHELYELRVKAIEEKISLADLFRLMYLFNQRRGFKSNKKANQEEKRNDEDIIGEKKSEITIEKVKIISIEPTGEKKGKQKREELKIILEDGRYGYTDKFLFKRFKGETTILEIKKENVKSSIEPKYTFSFPTKWQQNRKELNESIIKSGGFPGKYFYEEYLKAKTEGKLYDFKVRECIVNRELYENEFETIWKRQVEEWGKMGIDINHLPKFKEAIETIVPINNKEEKQKWFNSGLGEFIKEYIIYYQRDLKSQVKTISDCRFEERFYKKIDKETGEVVIMRDGPKCCPKSHPNFQEFRIWQQINNLICYNQREEEITLSDEIRVDLYNYLNEREDADKDEIFKFLRKLSEEIESINIFKSWSGNRTLYFFKKILKGRNYNGSHLFNDKDKFLRLWHLLYSVGDEKGIRNGLKKIDENLPEEVIKIFCEIDYKEKQYASLSLKAINNILPLMKCGTLFNEKDLSKKIKERIADFLNSNNYNQFDEKTLFKLKQRKSINAFQGLSYYEAASLIYGKHSAKQFEEYNSPENIQFIPRHSLRNPVVEQIVNETLMLVKEIWTKYPELKDAEIRVELARELKSNKEDRKRISDSQEKNKNINKDIIEEIRRYRGENYNPSFSEIEKIKLWHEAGECSPYTGEVLNISSILSSATQIDHIIPRARFYNDGFINKTVCESHINADKDKCTSYEYLNKGTKYDKLPYDDFLQFIKRFSPSKRRMFTLQEIPEDFVERQKKDTQFISTRIKEELGKIVGINNVKTTTGQITDFLKEQWGIAELMRRLIKPRFEDLQEKYKIDIIKEQDVLDKDGNPTGKRRTIIKGYSKRFDHRHHAIDALIIACTRQGIIQQLNSLNQIYNRIKPNQEKTIGDSFRKFIPPTGVADKDANKFYSIVEKAIDSVITSYKNKKRLVNKGINWYQKFLPEKNEIGYIKQNTLNGERKNWAIKGQLHLETNYGVKEFNGQLRHISNCKLSSLTENKIKNIVDINLKTKILDHIHKIEYNGDIKKAFSPEGTIEFNKDIKMPVYNVRILEDGIIGKVEGKVPLYNPERKLEVEKGNNFCVAVYEHSETKEREFDVIAFFDAVQLKTSNQNPYQTEVGVEFEKKGYRMIFTLTHFDLVYIPEFGEDISSINWNDKKSLFYRIYRVVKFSGTNLYFQPHNYSTEITIHEGKATSSKDYMGEFGKGTNGTMYLLGSNFLIKNTCIKLNVDRLGNVKPYTEKAYKKTLETETEMAE